MTEIVPAPDGDMIAFAVTGVESREGLEPHGPVARLERTIGQLKADYDRVVGQILAMTEHTPKTSGLHLTNVEVALGFNAAGELGFITVAKVSVGVEATVTLTFERS
ncbi:MAG: Pepco domain-containing protein [Nitrososphaerales archaeon]